MTVGPAFPVRYRVLQKLDSYRYSSPEGGETLGNAVTVTSFLPIPGLFYASVAFFLHDLLLFFVEQGDSPALALHLLTFNHEFHFSLTGYFVANSF